MSVPEAVRIDKPLRLADLLATAIRMFGRRPWAYAAVGVLQAGALLVTAVTPFAADLVILALAFSAAYALTVRLAVGDSITEALARVGRRAPVLAALALVVAVPFYLGSAWLVLLVLSALWLGLTTFAIPAAMVESPEVDAVGGRLVHALSRTAALARVEYIHAVGVVAALVVVYLVVGVVLAVALFSFADNGKLAALAIAQVVLAPFFFLGLTVLYFEQQARALERKG